MDGMPVYVNREDPTKILEYYKPLRRWQIKPVEGGGNDLCWGYIDSQPNQLPGTVPGPIWTGKGEGSWWMEQPRVTITENAGGDAVELSGFTGQHSGKVNGVYRRVTVDSESGLPVYVKRDFVDKWLEYHVATRTWQLKPPVDKGRDACWAFNVNPRKSLPQEVSSVWIAKDAFEEHVGSTITIVKK